MNKTGGGHNVFGAKGRKKMVGGGGGTAPSATAAPQSTVSAASAATNGAENTTRRPHSPSIEFDRAHSVDCSNIGPVPLRRASYAFDHHGQRSNSHHPQYTKQQKSSTPPYQRHSQQQHYHQQQMNCAVIMHQHSTPMANQQHRDSRSDCGSSSGLGGMGTPVKEECGSCSTSSNNSIVNCSHDSRDSGGPVSSSGGIPMSMEAASACHNGNGHRSLVATATLTPPNAMATTTISPVSSIPTLVQPQHQQQQQAFSAASVYSASIPQQQVHHPASHHHHHHQFGAFNSPILPPPPPQLPTGHHAAQQQQHSQMHPHQQQQHFTSHQQFNQQQLAQINAIHAAAAAMCGVVPTNQQNGVTNLNGIITNSSSNNNTSPIPPPPYKQQQQQNPWSNGGTNLNGGLNPIGGHRSAATMLPPPQQQQQQQPSLLHQAHPLPMGRTLYTMTCETAALASVGAAAVTAGYHVTLEPCASAPPIILSGQQMNVESANSETADGAGDSAGIVNNNEEQRQAEKTVEYHNAAVPQEGASDGGGVRNDDATDETATTANSNEEGQQQREQQRGNDENANLQAINGPANGEGGEQGQQQQPAQNGPASGSNTANRHMPPGVPPEIAAAISGGHDLFVHIHPGDAIALAVGNEIQHIYGPATIRMVSQSAPPSAIPMNVPQGHVVQQLLDRQGYLSHIIMSPQEMPPQSNAIPTPPMGNNAAATQQMMLAQQQPQMQMAAINSQRMQNALLPLQHYQMPPHSSPSPQKNVQTGRYRPSPSSSASPPNMLSVPSQQQQQFVLPPGYDQLQQQQQQQFGTNDAGAAVQYGSYGGGNQLNKWSPRNVPHQQQPHYHQQQQYMGGGGGRRGGGGPAQLMQQQQQPQQLASASNQHLGSFYMDPTSGAQLFSAGGTASPSIAASLYGQPNAAHQQQQQQAQSILLDTSAYGQPQQQQYTPTMSYGVATSGGGGGPTVEMPTANSDAVMVGQMSIEEDEKERLRDALSSLQPPVVTRVGERDADVVWQELDTSEAAASLPGFPEINQSEFAYQLILYKQSASTSVCYKTDANSGNVMHLQRLRPGTEYMICIRADLPGHGITGHPSAYTPFRTHSARPDAPSMPRLVNRQPTAISLQWQTPNCNGAPIGTYCLQMAKGKSAPFDTVYEGGHDQTVVNGLDSVCCYRFRVFARNDIGQSDSSPALTVYPDRNASQSGGGVGPGGVDGQRSHPHHAHHPNSHHPQHHAHHPNPSMMVQQPHLLSKGQSSPSSSSTLVQQQTSTTTTRQSVVHPPTVHSVMAKAVKLTWNDVHHHQDHTNVTLEMSDFSVRGTPHFAPVPVDCYASSRTFANVTGLQSNREYRFRLAVSTHSGEMLHSEFVTVRTQRGHNEQQQQPQQQNDEQQQQQQRASPAVKSAGGNGGQQQQQFQKRSSGGGPQQQQMPQLQKKQQTTISTKAGSAAATVQQQQRTATPQKVVVEEIQSTENAVPVPSNSPATVAPKKETTQQKAPNCSAPKFVSLTCECAKVDWRLLTPRKGNSVDSQTSSNASPSPSASSAATSNCALMFELQRVDRAQPLIVYSGSEPEFVLNGLRPVEHLQLRVRAVHLDTEGRRFEGDWSQVGSACTPSAPPSAPRNVRLVEPSSPTTISSVAEGGTNAAAVAADESDENSDVGNHRRTQKKQHPQKQHQSNGGSAGNATITINWDQPTQSNGAAISEYTVYMQRFALDDAAAAEKKPVEERVLGTSTDCHFQTPRLQSAQHYVFAVSAHNEAGESPKSELFVYDSPPGVPDPPRDFHAEALSTTELQLSWTEPCNCNGAPINSYHLNCYRLYNTRNNGMEMGSANDAAVATSSSSRHRQLVSQQIVPSSQRLLLVQSLDTDSDYELVLQAENVVGKSSREVCRCATFQEPPAAPELMLAQATANTLKLKWNPIGDAPASANWYFYLERENENGTFSPVYEGDLRTAKVKGLRERSTHHFRIRAAIAKGLMLGAWSKRFSFQTTRQPPPAPKQAPIVTELTPELFQLEWNAVRPSAKEQQQQSQQLSSSAEFEQQQQQTGLPVAAEQQQFIYRLQVAPKLSSSVKEKSAVEVWKVVYEGTSTQCTVSVPAIGNSPQTRQARLFVVQQFTDSDGQLVDECVSAPSPLVVFSAQKTPNESPRKRPLQAGSKNAPGPSASGSRGRQQQAAVHYPNPKEPKMTVYKRLKRFGSWMKKTVSEKDCALIVLTIFVLLAFGIAVLLNNYYLN